MLANPGFGAMLRTSAFGQEQTYARQNGMAGLPPIATAKADPRKQSCPLTPESGRVRRGTPYARFGPIADICSAQGHVCVFSTDVR